MTEASGNQKTIDKVENWVFPLKVGTTRSIDPQQYYKALAKAEDGFYPIGANGLWHGGVHFDDASGLVSDKTEVRCIADGEVVAYRIDKTYPVSEYGSKRAPFSTGFVLVRHRLELPAPPASPATAGGTPASALVAGPSLIFFSLYMHLLDWQGYQTSPALKRPGFWNATYKVKAAASDKLLGLRVRSSESAGNTPILTVLPRGTTVFTKPAPDTRKWLEVVDVIPAVAELAEQTGWVFKEEMQRISADQYFVGDKARDLPQEQKNGAIVRDAFAQGRPIGFLPVGTQIRISDEKNSGKYRKLLEIVSGESIPVLVPDAEGALPGYVSLDLLDAMSRPEDMDKVVPLKTAYKVKAGELLGHVGKYQNQSDSAPKNLLHLEVFSCEDVKTFIQQSRSRAANLPAKDRTLVKVSKGAKLISHVAGMNATTPPKSSDPGHQIGYDLIIPLQVLEALPSERKIKAQVVMGGLTTYTYWWHLEGMLADVSGNAISGWFAEPDIALSRHSPFEWEGFTFIEETVSHVEHYAAFLEAQKELTEEELATYQPEVVKAGAGPVTQSLYKILDKDGDKKLLPDEIREALGKPWFSQPISQMLATYQSEWHYKKESWDSLDKLIGHSKSEPNKVWAEEKKRIQSLSWWSALMGGEVGCESGRCWYIHPVGLFSNARSLKQHPEIIIGGAKVELEFLELYDGSIIEEDDYIAAADALGCEVEAVKAVAITETASSGSYFTKAGDDEVTAILFERHYFHQLTNGQFDSSNPDISSSSRGGYGTYSAQYGKLIRAYRLSANAALKSASWGRFQIMGKNFSSAGYLSVEEFVRDLSRSEKNHLKAFVNFVKADSVLSSAIVQKDWLSFALRYNGPAQDGYDVRMTSNYNLLKGI
ncbi:N-acetylmuramidase family protein [Pseudomonas protegens]|uniref:N-acetylmuramidase family protein n=1 Tax=Pseudomonas protegens TaxID=380021 RepID=UPI0019D6C6E5|nr:N-acetylmuramidase family protein [Pseudomonas protegens]